MCQPWENHTLATLLHVSYRDAVVEMIRSTKGKRIQDILANRAGEGFPAGLMTAARRKLTMLDAARELADLHAPPANRLKALHGDRKGQHSIRVSDRWHLCFAWTASGHADADLTDYH